MNTNNCVPTSEIKQNMKPFFAMILNEPDKIINELTSKCNKYLIINTIKKITMATL